MFIHLLALYLYSSITFMLFFISKYAFLFYSFIFYGIDKKRSLFKKKRSRLLSETGTFFDFFCF